MTVWHPFVIHLVGPLWEIRLGDEGHTVPAGMRWGKETAIRVARRKAAKRNRAETKLRERRSQYKAELRDHMESV